MGSQCVTRSLCVTGFLCVMVSVCNGASVCNGVPVCDGISDGIVIKDKGKGEMENTVITGNKLT